MEEANQKIQEVISETGVKINKLIWISACTPETSSELFEILKSFSDDDLEANFPGMIDCEECFKSKESILEFLKVNERDGFVAEILTPQPKGKGITSHVYGENPDELASRIGVTSALILEWIKTRNGSNS